MYISLTFYLKDINRKKCSAVQGETLLQGQGKQEIIDIVRSKKTRIPTLPVVMNNIIATARDKNTSARDLAKFITNDQAISARVLKIANSPYYGMSSKIDSISRAIVVIGFREVISLALATGVITSFAKSSTMDMTSLWKHSIGVGFASRIILEQIGQKAKESTMLIGLLHDLGKVIFSIYFPEEYARLLENVSSKGLVLNKAEKESMGMDHAELASLIMEHWNFPAHITEPIHFHHDPLSCPGKYKHMAMILNIADFICHKAGIGSSGNHKVKKAIKVFANVGLSPDDILPLTRKLKDEEHNIEYFLEALE